MENIELTEEQDIALDKAWEVIDKESVNKDKRSVTQLSKDSDTSDAPSTK